MAEPATEVGDFWITQEMWITNPVKLCKVGTLERTPTLNECAVFGQAGTSNAVAFLRLCKFIAHLKSLNVPNEP